jgi:site-specific recombinase XerD
MAWVRQLPSGKWAATVYTPAGRRSKTHVLRGSVAKWAADLESDIRRGEFLDPELATKTLGDVWQRYGSARRLETASRKRDVSTWRNHVAPRWGRVPVGAVLKPDVQAWVNGLEAAGVGGWTIIAALNVLKATLELAVDARMLRANPARRVKPPMPPEHVDRVLTGDEETQLLAALDDLFPGRRDGRLFVEGLLETGARWQELAAVRREAVDLRRGLVAIGPVLERDGTIRDYPKGARSRQAAGFRDAPLGRDYLTRLRPVVLETEPGEMVFTAPRGGRLDYTRWRARVWVPAVAAAGLDDPQPTPHDCRHSFGTRLADAGVEQHDRMELMGHRDVRSAQRYTHSSEARHDRARAALAAARAGK